MVKSGDEADDRVGFGVACALTIVYLQQTIPKNACATAVASPVALGVVISSDHS